MHDKVWELLLWRQGTGSRIVIVLFAVQGEAAKMRKLAEIGGIPPVSGIKLLQGFLCLLKVHFFLELLDVLVRLHHGIAMLLRGILIVRAGCEGKRKAEQQA
jgi:hypothetical protein